MRAPLRVGIVGCGAMGAMHADAWKATPATIAAFYAPSHDRCAEIALRCGAVACDSLGKLIDRVDVVDICSPTDTHCAIAVEAASARRTVLCEKPLGRSSKEAMKIIDACRVYGVQLFVGHTLRFFSEYRAARQRVASGELGLPGVIRLRRLAYMPTGLNGNWFANCRRSGGVIFDMMIHDFDYARWVAGEATQVYCVHLSNRPADHACAIVTHADGALSHIEGSWAYPKGVFRASFEIACQRGVIVSSSDSRPPIEMSLDRQPSELDNQSADNRQPHDVPSPAIVDVDDNPYHREIAACYASIVDGAPFPVSADDALQATRIAEAAELSSQQGLPIALSRNSAAGGEA